MAGENVLLILLDDWRGDMLRYVTSLNPANLAATTFTSVRAHTPVCAPSRLGLYTCQYAQQNGTDIGQGTANFDIDEAIYKWVADAGYYVGHIGKFLNVYDTGIPIPAGIDWWRQFPDDNAYRLHGFDVHNGTTTSAIATPSQPRYMAQSFEDFLTAAGTDPWFCVLAPTDPHAPFDADTEPSARFGFDWLNQELDLLPDGSAAPSWILDSPDFTSEQLRLFKGYWKQQARELNRLDRDLIRPALDLVDLSNTIVIVTSDNGLPLGEHRLWSVGVIKNDLYEASCAIPMVIAGPGFPLRSVDTPVMAHVDTARTICDITGATPTTTPTGGLSLVDLMATGETGDWEDRPSILFRTGTEGSLSNNPMTGWAIVSGTMKLMRWEKVLPEDPDLDPDDVYEMYDLSADPTEHTNLAYLGGAYTTVRNNLEIALDAWITTPT